MGCHRVMRSPSLELCKISNHYALISNLRGSMVFVEHMNLLVHADPPC